MDRVGQRVGLSIVIAGLIPCAVWAVDLGDNIGDVKAEMGKPSSSIQIGDWQVLYYDRGSIEAVKDVVVEVDLVSQQEADAARRLREETRARVERERLEKALARHAKGVNLREAKLTDTAFMQSSASRRVSFWRSFKSRYPDVRLGMEYEEALRELHAERQAQQKDAQAEARLRDLEQRVLEAEERAVRAEQVVHDEARRRDRNRYATYPYPSVHIYKRPGVSRSGDTPGCLESPGVKVSRGNHVGLRQGSSALSLKPGYIRSKGVHSGNTHNRALQTHQYPRASYTPYNSIGAYGFQRAAPSMRTTPGVHAHVSFGQGSMTASGR